MKNTFLIVAILCVYQSFAQSTRSIEVKVKDTVELKVTSADLLLTITQDYDDYYGESYEDEYVEYDEGDYYDYNYEEDYYNHMTRQEKRQEKKNNKKFEKEMKKLEEELARYEESMPPVIEEVTYDSTEIDYPIESYESYYMTFTERKAKWITYLTENNIPFDTLAVGTNEYYDYGSFNIQLNAISTEKMDLVFQYADSIQNSYANLTKVNYESLETKMDVVYADLYKKAQTEANSLAKILSAVPGKVTRVYEPVIDLTNFGESYLELMNKLLKTENKNLKPESKKTIVERIFVFEIK